MLGERLFHSSRSDSATTAICSAEGQVRSYTGRILKAPEVPWLVTIWLELSATCRMNLHAGIIFSRRRLAADRNTELGGESPDLRGRRYYSRKRASALLEVIRETLAPTRQEDRTIEMGDYGE